MLRRGGEMLWAAASSGRTGDSQPLLGGTRGHYRSNGGNFMGGAMFDSVIGAPVMQKRTTPRVLLIDDDEFVRVVYGRVLTKRGYDTRTVSNAAAALVIADEWRPDVILLDIAMPFVTGFEAAPILKLHPATRSASLVAFSNYVRDGDADAMQHFDFDAVLPKPHCADELVERLKWILLTQACTPRDES
jgi:CheY-like chemotaxis protein